MSKHVVYIEGSKDLAKGFHHLFRKVLPGKMPKITFQGPKAETLKQYSKHSKGPFANKNALVLVDSDGPLTNAIEKIRGTTREGTFFMVQEMEAWFISQPEILKSFYRLDSKLPLRPPQEIPKPFKVIENFSKGSKRGSYHKTRHASELLGLLDPIQLQKDFPEFRNLIASLNS